MAGEINITVIGNLTTDPELRFTASGAAVTNFTVASTPRTFDKNSGKWVDGQATFLRCSIWRQPAENVAESFKRGDRVVVVGRLKQRSFEKDGEKRTVVELDAEEVAASTRYATVSPRKAARQEAAKEDPWGGDTGSYGGDEAPPF